MKKPIKIILIILAVITLLTVIASAIMLNAVSGDELFYMNSTLGNIYAVSYRWVTLAAVLLTVFWVLFIVKKRASIMTVFSNLKSKMVSREPKTEKVEPKPEKIEPSAEKIEVKEITATTCTKCEKQWTNNHKFCPFCGEPVNAPAPPSEEKSE